MQQLKEQIARMDERIINIQKEIEDLHDEVSCLKKEIKEDGKSFVKKVEFIPIQRVIYALISVMGVTVIGALLNLIIKS